jgi:hypothetical protein
MKTLLVILLAIPSMARAQAVLLPIEVMGTAGTVKDASVKLPPGSGAKAVSLFLQIHNASYEGKISVQVNSSEWVSLTNTSAWVYNPGKTYGGIGGAFGSLKMTIPVSGVSDGKNVVRFRFNRTDGISSGFRVLAFNFLAADGTPLVPASQFVQDNPNNWKPPYSDDASVAEGQRLWETAKLNASPLVTKPLLVSCADCHPKGDLKYFNYSNYAIAKRAVFHSLSTKQGNQIASYIRLLNVPNPGRPWNPPYQPGPGIDANPVTSWAAGAGLQWALGSDAETLKYLDFAKPLNMREIPIAMQLPDWNHWLPRIHPKDAWGDAFDQSEFFKFLSTVRDRLIAAPDRKAYAQSGKFTSSLGEWYNRRRDFLKPRAEDWPADQWTPDHAERVYATALWHATKTWELMQEFGMEGYGPTGNERTWYGNALFAASPFMLKIPSSEKGLRGSALINEYAASVWYHSQIVVNVDNQGKPFNQVPTDWPYTYGKLKDLYGVSKYAEPMRLSLLVGKSIEVWDNAAGLDIQEGWNPHVKADLSRLVHFSYKPMWEETPADVRNSLITTLTDKWLTVNRKYTPQQFYVVGYADPTYTPRPWYSGNLGDKTAWMMQEYKTWGIPTTALETWGKSVWPLLGKTGSEGTGD